MITYGEYGEFFQLHGTQIRNVQYVVQRWKCKGIPEKECNEFLSNVDSRKPKQRCSKCQHEYRKLKNLELYYKRLRTKRLKKFLDGNV